MKKLFNKITNSPLGRMIISFVFGLFCIIDEISVIHIAPLFIPVIGFIVGAVLLILGFVNLKQWMAKT